MRFATKIGMCAGVIAAFAVSATVEAETISTGTYALSNHGDGNAQPPLYGLRLDGLFDGNSATTVTFDFDRAGADMRMDWDGTTIRIYGRAYGGVDVGSTTSGFGGADSNADGYADGYQGWVNIDFTYFLNNSLAGGDDDIWNTSATNTEGNPGSLSLETGASDFTSWGGSDDWNLQNKFSSAVGYSFRFGDEDDDNGHRGADGLSGWGWLNHDGDNSDIDTHLAASDWLFEARLIPLPPAVWMLAAGLLGIGAYRKRFA